jgi:hypothetical protein
MRIGMLKRAVNRLAVVAGSNGPCRFCQDWQGPVLVRGDVPGPAPCEACGRSPQVVRLLRIDGFYVTRQRQDDAER